MDATKQLEHQLSIQIENNQSLLDENKELQDEIENLKMQVEVLNSEVAKYKAAALSNL